MWQKNGNYKFQVNFNEPPITSWNTAQNFMQPNFPLGQTPQFQQQQKPLIPFPLQQSQDPLIPQPQGDFQQPVTIFPIIDVNFISSSSFKENNCRGLFYLLLPVIFLGSRRDH